MVKKIKKKIKDLGKKTGDYDPLDQLDKDSPIKKKKVKNTDFFNKDNNYPV